MIGSRYHLVALVCGVLSAFGEHVVCAADSSQTSESYPAIVTRTQVTPVVTQVVPHVTQAYAEVRGKISEVTVPTPNSFPAGIT